jgi:hypothetical protein
MERSKQRCGAAAGSGGIASWMQRGYGILSPTICAYLTGQTFGSASQWSARVATLLRSADHYGLVKVGWREALTYLRLTFTDNELGSIPSHKLQQQTFSALRAWPLERDCDEGLFFMSANARARTKPLLAIVIRNDVSETE